MELISKKITKNYETIQKDSARFEIGKRKEYFFLMHAKNEVRIKKTITKRDFFQRLLFLM